MVSLLSLAELLFFISVDLIVRIVLSDFAFTKGKYIYDSGFVWSKVWAGWQYLQVLADNSFYICCNSLMSFFEFKKRFLCEWTGDFDREYGSGNQTSVLSPNMPARKNLVIFAFSVITPQVLSVIPFYGFLGCGNVDCTYVQFFLCCFCYKYTLNPGA